MTTGIVTNTNEKWYGRLNSHSKWHLGMIGISMLLNGLLWLIALFNTINEYPSLGNDFRNRIVGARLMQDGLDPYFYIWKTGGPLRYYDTFIDPESFISVCTSTPFFHWILGPICNLPQYQLNLLWFLVEWASIGTCVLTALLLTKDAWRRQLILLVAGALAVSIGFRHHFFQMQNYLLVPALIMLAIYWWKTKRSVIYWIGAGICLAAVVLIRPTLLLLFAPLIFYVPFRKVGLTMAICLLVYALFALVNTHQRNNWKSFALAIQYRLGNKPMPPRMGLYVNYNPIQYTKVEGVDVMNDKSAIARKWLYDNKDEISVYSYVHLRLFQKMPSHKLLRIFQAVVLLFFSISVLFFANRKSELYWLDLVTIGFSAYWFFEFFDIYPKLLYYYVLFLYILLLHIIYAKKVSIIALGLVGIGILLNIFNVPIKLNCTLGQILILTGLWVYMIQRKLSVKTQPPKHRFPANP